MFELFRIVILSEVSASRRRSTYAVEEPAPSQAEGIPASPAPTWPRRASRSPPRVPAVSFVIPTGVEGLPGARSKRTCCSHRPQIL